MLKEYLKILESKLKLNKPCDFIIDCVSYKFIDRFYNGMNNKHYLVYIIDDGLFKSKVYVLDS